MEAPAQLSAVPVEATGTVYGEPRSTADGTMVIPVARVRRRGTGTAARVTTRPVGVFVIQAGAVKWKPAIDVTRLALLGQLIGLVSAALAGVAMVRRPPWPDLYGDVSPRS